MKLIDGRKIHLTPLWRLDFILDRTRDGLAVVDVQRCVGRIP
jgi:hypothetical protein